MLYVEIDLKTSVLTLYHRLFSDVSNDQRVAYKWLTLHSQRAFQENRERFAKYILLVELSSPSSPLIAPL